MLYIVLIYPHNNLDTELLLNILKDSRAFHFTGDIAQTILYNSHFRF
jgi:hypothetical protein